jgi:hypothetical protein
MRTEEQRLHDDPGFTESERVEWFALLAGELAHRKTLPSVKGGRRIVKADEFELERVDHDWGGNSIAMFVHRATGNYVMLVDWYRHPLVTTCKERQDSGLQMGGKF